MRKFSFILALLAGFMLPLTAVAQDSSRKASSSKSSKSSKKSSSKDKGATEEVAEPAAAPEPDKLSFSDEQTMLNNQAVEATEKGNYSKAEQLFKAMLEIREFNITWMNLGQTYASQGKCIEAAEAFSKVAGAARISDYSHEEITSYTNQYVKSLAQKCSAKVVLKCKPAEMTVSFDGGKKVKCSSKPIALVPGRHSIYGETSFGFNTIGVELPANQTTETEIEVINPDDVLAEAGITHEALTKKSKLFKALGYPFIGIGAATLGAGIGLAVYYYFDYKDKFKINQNDQSRMPSEELRKYRNKNTTYMNVGYALSAVGGAMLVAGITLVVVDAVKYKPQIERFESNNSKAFMISPMISPDFGGFSLTTEF